MRQLYTALITNNRDSIAIRREFQPQQLLQNYHSDNDFFGKQRTEYQTVGLTIAETKIPIFNMPDIEQITENQSSIKHEGLDRIINTIYISSSLKVTLAKELAQIGKENGFSVQQTDSGDNIWVEDTTIRLHNGKVYIPNTTPYLFYNNTFTRDYIEIIKARKHISDSPQGAVAERRHTALPYINTIPIEQRVYGLSYLEGGNVLNCRLADGSPGAVIGTESIDYTMRAMQLEDTPENREIAKAQIAKDLELPEASITYIPQFDFHIDMWFRPLQNGVMAVPDFTGGINMLTEILKSPSITRDKKIELELLRESLVRMEKNTKQFITEAEENLRSAGYETIKIPCFSMLGSIHPQVNFMNGVGGTNKEGKTYYITNTSEIPGLDSRIEQYFKEQVGIDNVYFVHSNYLLSLYGGLDCVTQEK
jgi:hypothetical protein